MGEGGGETGEDDFEEDGEDEDVLEDFPGLGEAVVGRWVESWGILRRARHADGIHARRCVFGGWRFERKATSPVSV